MSYAENISKQYKEIRVGTDWRLTLLYIFFFFIIVVLLARLFLLQVIKHDAYTLLASNQYLSYKEYDPLRGVVYIQENAEGGRVAIAENRKFWEIYAVPYEIENPAGAAGKLAPLLRLDEESEIQLKARLSKGNDPYEPIQNKVTDEVKDAIDSLAISAFSCI